MLDYIRRRENIWPIVKVLCQPNLVSRFPGHLLTPPPVFNFRGAHKKLKRPRSDNNRYDVGKRPDKRRNVQLPKNKHRKR